MLVVASVVVFLVIEHAPGDPARFQLGLSATPAQLAIERHKLGLDSSVANRYLIWLRHALELNLGKSIWGMRSKRDTRGLNQPQ